MVLGLVLAGCGHTEAHFVGFQAPAPPVSGTELHLGSVPARAFHEVGLVQALGEGDGAEEAALLDALRGEGARRGCEAVVKVRVSRGVTGGQAIGVCVRWAAVR
jgi:hypothetical protein